MFQIEWMGEGDARIITLRDSASGTSADIAVGYGFNCYSFKAPCGGTIREFLWTEPGFPDRSLKASHNGTPILAPFPNRIRGGRFREGGREYELFRNDHDKNAIHGLVIDQPWRTTAQGTSAAEGAWVRGEFQLSIDRPDLLPMWPADFRIAFTYRLFGRELRTEIEATNPADEALPFGVGTHPYFRFPLEVGTPLGELEIVVPASQSVELIDCLPTGVVRPVSASEDLRAGMRFDRRTFDDVFTGLEAGEDGMIAHLLRDHRAKVDLEILHSPEFLFAVVYTPPHRQSISIEPYTCVTDAVNLEASGLRTGLWRLGPGESRFLTIDYRVHEH